MLPDHYATLGIAPSSRPAAIRTAYVELMRRYHPDRNPSAAGAAWVRAITAAYAVLGVPDRRAAYDLKRIRMVAAAGSVFMPERPQWRLTPLLAVIFGLAVIVLLLPLLIPPPLIQPERSGPTSSVGGRQQAAPLEQDQSAIGSPLAGMQMPRQATDQLNAPAGARNELTNVLEQMLSAAQPPEAVVARAQAIQPRREPPQPLPAAPAHRAGPSARTGQAPAWQQPIKPAWQQPIKPAWQQPLKAAWQRPLPPAKD